MGTFQVWTERLVLTLRTLGIALMLVVLCWVLLALVTSVGNVLSRGIAAALLVGYAGGQAHAWWRQRMGRLPETLQSAEFQARRQAHIPMAAIASAAASSEADTVPTSESASIKASVERELAASKDEELRRAVDLTARQLQHAIEIAEGTVGKERAESSEALVGAILEVLATNYRLAIR